MRACAHVGGGGGGGGCSKSEFHVAREDTKFARNNLKVNYLPLKAK